MTDAGSAPDLKPRRIEAWAERVIFHHRFAVLAILAAVTVALAVLALGLRPNAGFQKMIPLDHPYMVNLAKHDRAVPNGNVLRIVVAATEGDIFSAEYLETLQKVSTDAFFLDGVDRAGFKSLWTKNVQWKAVTEEGFDGGVVIPDEYDGSPAEVERVRQNVLKSGEVGRTVANDFTSSTILVPLLDFDPRTNGPLDYWEFSKKLEDIRERYESPTVDIRIVGFAKLVGDLIDGIVAVAGFFLVAFLIALGLLFVYARCFRGALAPLLCSAAAVIWQLGILRVMGIELDPYSILVPFLVFAIGVSHGVQIVNAVALNAGAGLDRLEAARGAFRMLFTAGLTALASDAVGFFTLWFIDIEVIRELAVSAGVGVAAVVITNLVLLPVVLSYIGISRRGVNHARNKNDGPSRSSALLAKMTRRGPAATAIAVGLGLAAIGLVGAGNLKTGDLDRGAPELRPDSRYNRDLAYVDEHYSISADVLFVMVETAPEKCQSYEVMYPIDQLQWRLDNIDGVAFTESHVTLSKSIGGFLNEGNIKWAALARNQTAITSTLRDVPQAYTLDTCRFASIAVFLDDHKYDTLQRVTAAVEEFARENNRDDLKFLLAGGAAGVEAATNQSVSAAQVRMTLFVYVVVGAMVFWAFRSWRAMICIMVPLGLTSLLCQGLMSVLGIGVKVATLPVICLGVGIGVDFGIYIYSRMESYLKSGSALESAVEEALKSVGKAVVFTGLTLAIGVLTWVFSPIKFQADMGVLLAFMFLWNMLGALILLPALSRFVLGARWSGALGVPRAV